MKLAALYTVACAVLAMTEAGAIPLLHGWHQLVAGFSAVVFLSGARGGMCAIEVATRPEGWRP